MNLLLGESQIMYVGSLPSTRGSVNPDSSGGAAHRGFLPDHSAEREAERGFSWRNSTAASAGGHTQHPCSPGVVAPRTLGTMS